jgi:hypothetical protein
MSDKLRGIAVDGNVGGLVGWLSRAAALVCAGLMSACSTGPYQQQITQFDTSLKTAQQSFSALEDQQVSAAAVNLTEVAAEQGKALNEWPCKLTKSPKVDPKNCTLRLGQTDSVQIKSAGPKGADLMKAFVQYGDGLVTLATAKDISDLNSGIAKANSSFSGIIKVVGGTASFVPYVGPALDLAAFVFNQYLEAERVRALRAVIISADGVVDLAAKELADEADALQYDAFHKLNFYQQALVKQVGMTNGNWTGGTELLASEAIQGEAALKKLAELDAGSTFKQLGAAHKKLVEAARQPEFSLKDAESAILAFAQKADALYQASQPKAAPKQSTQ